MSGAVDPLRAPCRLADQLVAAGAEGARIAVVLGSGLGAFATGLEDPRELETATLSDLPESRVPGHAGRLVVGTLGGERVLVQMGRVHLYEGWSAFEVTRAIRAFAVLGIEAVLLTNASGSLDPNRPPGTFLAIEDHLNLQWNPPLLAHEAGTGSPYDRRLLARLVEVADAHRIPLARGLYAGVLGPSYETPAEIRALRDLGADAVGMSTVCEAVVAAASGMRVGAIACLTNYAAGVGASRLDHEDVVRVGRDAAPGLVTLLTETIRGMVADEDWGRGG